MFRKTLPVIVLLAITRASSAEPPQTEDRLVKRAGEGTLTAYAVRTGLFMISGGGCNSLLRLSANGMILVDGKLPGNYEAILAWAKKLSYSDQPIRVVINTDYREEHTGNNAKFLAAGTQIIAHENVKLNLTTYDPPGGKVAPPTITYDHDYVLRLGGVEAQLMHFGNAHTSGDTVVYFPNLKVIAVGDLFAPTPDPDYSAGGSLEGWGLVLAKILKLDFDIAVPSTGPMITRIDLEAFRTKIDTLVVRNHSVTHRPAPKNIVMQPTED